MFDVNDDAKVGFRRIELLTGPERRRRWSAADKARIVQESLIPGARVGDVARRWQLCPKQVFTWRRGARGARAEKPGESVAPACVAIVGEHAPAAGAKGAAPTVPVI